MCSSRGELPEVKEWKIHLFTGNSLLLSELKKQQTITTNLNLKVIYEEPPDIPHRIY